MYICVHVCVYRHFHNLTITCALCSANAEVMSEKSNGSIDSMELELAPRQPETAQVSEGYYRRVGECVYICVSVFVLTFYLFVLND